MRTNKRTFPGTFHSRLYFNRRLWELKFKAMKTQEVKINWNEHKRKLKQKFELLTDNDLLFEVGRRDEMLAKLQTKLGKTKDELIRIIAAL